VRRRTLAIDTVLAAALAAGVLVLTPGVALAAVIALVALALCALSLGFEAVLSRRRPKPPKR
jgi:hypothetical protein